MNFKSLSTGVLTKDEIHLFEKEHQFKLLENCDAFLNLIEETKDLKIIEEFAHEILKKIFHIALIIRNKFHRIMVPPYFTFENNKILVTYYASKYKITLIFSPETPDSILCCWNSLFATMNLEKLDTYFLEVLGHYYASDMFHFKEDWYMGRILKAVSDGMFEDFTGDPSKNDNDNLRKFRFDKDSLYSVEEISFAGEFLTKLIRNIIKNWENHLKYPIKDLPLLNNVPEFQLRPEYQDIFIVYDTEVLFFSIQVIYSNGSPPNTIIFSGIFNGQDVPNLEFSFDNEDKAINEISRDLLTYLELIYDLSY